MTRPITRRLVTFLAVVVACVLPIGGAQATESNENVAQAVIEQDDGRAFEFAWDIDRERGDEPVLHLNKADAFARCMRCEATAIAFQIVLVNGSPSVVAPMNVAQAVNDQCTDCTVVAEARQFVRVVPEPVKFTQRGRAVLTDVRRDLEALGSQDLPVDQLHIAVEAQEARVREVLGTELAPTADPDADVDMTERRTLQAVDVG